MTVAARGRPRAMDPRIRQRRVEVRRKAGRRRLRVVVAGVGTFAACAAGLAVVHSRLFTVSSVEVGGVSGTRAAAVRAVLAGQLHRPLVDVSTGGLDRSLQALPWVGSADVVRSWPSGLSVTVDVRVPVAQQPDRAGGWARLDATGRVVEVARTPEAGVIRLDGLRPAGRPGTFVGAARSALRVAGALPGDVRARVGALSAEPGGGVALTLLNGASVDLGPPSDLAAKFSSLRTVLAQIDMTGVRTIDLRVPDQPVLTRS